LWQQLGLSLSWSINDLEPYELPNMIMVVYLFPLWWIFVLRFDIWDWNSIMREMYEYMHITYPVRKCFLNPTSMREHVWWNVVFVGITPWWWLNSDKKFKICYCFTFLLLPQ
jgi:hypothetical protein